MNHHKQNFQKLAYRIRNLSESVVDVIANDVDCPLEYDKTTYHADLVLRLLDELQNLAQSMSNQLKSAKAKFCNVSLQTTPTFKLNQTADTLQSISIVCNNLSEDVKRVSCDNKLTNRVLLDVAKKACHLSHTLTKFLA
jgi:hypothetical protein